MTTIKFKEMQKSLNTTTGGKYTQTSDAFMFM